MPAPHLGFYHCMANTYGTWLRGDPRGWRSRHHRQHVEGDYKHPPPPGRDEDTLLRNRGRLARHAVVLPPSARAAVCRLFADALLHHGVVLKELVVDGVHIHAVACFDACKQPPASAHREDGLDPRPRWYIGRAKSWSSSRACKDELIPGNPSGLWAVRGKVMPVEDAAHLDYLITTYLPGHVSQGGVLWSRLTCG